MKTPAPSTPLNVAQKIIAAHLVEGDPAKDAELGIRIDQTLTQDATGTMAYLQFESMDVPHVRNELAVSYVDHNTVQIGFENADDHDFLKAGDLVTVKILSLDWERDRISLSIRQCQAKPLKPRTPEEIARDAEAQDVADWMEAHKGETDSFSSLGSAFDGLKL